LTSQEVEAPMKTGWLAGVLLIAAVIPAQAQQADPRWTPWLGCWQLMNDSVRQTATADAARSNQNETRVCVGPANEAGGVTLNTLIETQSVLEQTIVADGAKHPVDEAGCRGEQRADWSRSGDRLFSYAELACADEGTRKVSGLAMVTDGTWIDIQAIEIAGREHIRVRRFRRSADQTGVGTTPARPAASVALRLGAGRFTLGEVKEASAQMSPRVIEAALVETNAGFDLSSRALIDLDQAGVPESVIDLMVALSFPTHFIVDRTRSEATSASTGFGSLGPYSSWPYDAYWDSPYLPYYYSPFGYAYWAGYGVPYYPIAGFVTFDAAQPVTAGSTGGARLVNGIGYTQVRPREPERIESLSGSQQSSSGDSSSSGGSSGGASSGGYSSGGSSADTGRTAEPR
jgi:uncharacterized membrane protein YgcG